MGHKMNYALGWLEHWSTKRESLDPRVITLFNEEGDGWFEHERIWYFIADSDVEAKQKALEFVGNSQDEIEVFGLSNRDTKQTILTEEEL